MDSEPLYFFERAHFNRLARNLKRGFTCARPFPHCVIDRFLPDDWANRLAEAFPGPGFQNFRLNESPGQWKKLSSVQLSDFEGVSPLLRHTLNELNGRVFLDFLETLTGIPGLIADPHFTGAGLHQILPGGKLGIHEDFNRDLRRNLDRRVNVLIYLNRDWSELWGGHLELWDQKMSRCESRIAPLLNRCVIFRTDSGACHGHPDPLACPKDRTRNSIALYYYTSPGSDEAREYHGPLWRRRQGERFPGPLSSLALRGLHWIEHRWRKLGKAGA